MSGVSNLGRNSDAPWVTVTRGGRDRYVQRQSQSDTSWIQPTQNIFEVLSDYGENCESWDEDEFPLWESSQNESKPNVSKSRGKFKGKRNKKASSPTVEHGMPVIAGDASVDVAEHTPPCQPRVGETFPFPRFEKIQNQRESP